MHYHLATAVAYNHKVGSRLTVLPEEGSLKPPNGNTIAALQPTFKRLQATTRVGHLHCR